MAAIPNSSSTPASQGLSTNLSKPALSEAAAEIYAFLARVPDRKDSVLPQVPWAASGQYQRADGREVTMNGLNDIRERTMNGVVTLSLNPLISGRCNTGNYGK
ncbi:hypothetical protein IQ07DRAFT_595842 [Pyrenochaeta sp. DS3sAY3a]|nr:hypothetical protein IQ07DRAFT_595842 [Pyrenochaeta sp. DS3sAY3a]